MKRPYRWQEMLLARAFSLGPLKFRNIVEKQLREKVPLTRFRERMAEGTVPFDPPLPRRTMAWLYETGLRARVQEETVHQAQMLLRVPVWKKNQDDIGTLELLTLLHNLQRLPQLMGEVRLRTRIKRLTKELQNLIYLGKLWRKDADWGTLRPEYKSTLAFINRRLKRKHPKLLKFQYQRAGVIEAMVVAIGLREKGSEEGILRMLRPSRLQRQRKPKPIKVRKHH